MQKKELKIALVGQPNCGKSTLFNAVAGFKVNTGNFSGTTVSFTETGLNFEGTKIKLIDLPGTYSITSSDLAEKVTRDFLLSREIDLIINVCDTSLLSRSLELTIQLMEMKIPMILALNMYDEAERKGIKINLEKVKTLTNIEAIPVIATNGTGIDELFKKAILQANNQYQPIQPVYDKDVEEALAEIEKEYPITLRTVLNVNSRFLNIRLLEMDEEFEEKVSKATPSYLNFVKAKRKFLAEMHDWPEETVFSSHRHACVLDLYEKIATHSSRKKTSMRETIDRFIMNPFGGLIAVVGSLLAMFYTAFSFGDLVSKLLETPFEKISALADFYSKGHGILGYVISGFLQGFEGGMGIVLPYLIPLLILLSIFEDTGFLPRIAFLVDGILHKFGLHGKSVVPFILGYGCSVPAIMATRNLENVRDRTLAMLLVPFISCSARTVVILAIAGKFLGPIYTFGIFVGNIVIVLFLSYLLSRFNINLTSGLVMEVPPLRKPYMNIILKKVWLRVYEFLVLAWPIIIISSVGLAILSNYNADASINNFFSPMTVSILKLPKEVGIALFLGIMRKELALIMLATALGTDQIQNVLSHTQMLTLVVFTTLYIPCVATLTTLWKEGGFKIFVYSSLLSLFVALFFAGLIAHLM